VGNRHVDNRRVDNRRVDTRRADTLGMSTTRRRVPHAMTAGRLSQGPWMLEHHIMYFNRLLEQDSRVGRPPSPLSRRWLPKNRILFR
jgi:hypothetical protein